MRSHKKQTLSVLVSVALGLTGTLMSLAASAATWVDASTSTLVSGAKQSVQGSANSFLPKNPTQTLATTAHLRKYQYYKGIRVLGAELIEHAKPATSVPAVTGSVVEGLSLSKLTPRLNKETALQTALDLYPDAVNVKRAKTELVIDVQGAKETLAYLVTFFADTKEGPKRPNILLDAQTGVVLRNFDGLTHVQIGTGPGGNTKTGRYIYGTQYPKLDVTKNGTTCSLETPNVRTVNLDHGTEGSNAFSFTCVRNNYQAINGAYSPLNDAHYFGNVVFNMYKDWLKTTPLTFQLLMKVHYSNGYDNAFWDGTSMTFGDGATTFYPLVSLDIVSHEVSHGFTEQNSGLQYWGQSGGLNESFSDIAGEAAECYRTAKADGSCTVDYQVGATIFKGQGALRYMDNPPQDGISIDNAADFNAYMDVHYSSGVYNKAFYLLSSQPGWGVKKTFQVFAKANQNYWTSTSDFNDAACGVEYAASELGYGSGAEKKVIRDTLAQVGAKCVGFVTPVVKEYSGDLVQGMWHYYGPFKSVNRSLIAQLTGVGNSDLYVRRGAKPTETTYDCRPFERDSAERCSLLPSSDIYVGVLGFSGTSTYKLSVTYYTKP